jgi:hypothetical protein
MRFPARKQDLLLVFVTLGCVVLGFFSYRQNQVIDVLNEELLKQAAKQHKTRLDKYAIEKELQRLKEERLITSDSVLVR